MKHTLKTVGIEQIFTLFMALDATLGAPNALPRNAPQKTLAFVAVGGTSGSPGLEVMRSGARNRVDQGLQCLLVHVRFLCKAMHI